MTVHAGHQCHNQTSTGSVRGFIEGCKLIQEGRIFPEVNLSNTLSTASEPGVRHLVAGCIS